MKKVKRFGVSLEEDLLKKLDALVSEHTFPNRSQAIRFLINKNVISRAWEHNREVAGCVVLVYDHHKRDLLTRSIDIQHQYQGLVLSVQHVHLDRHSCLEIIALKGKARKLKELADKLIGIKGMKHGQLVMSGVGSGK